MSAALTAIITGEEDAHLDRIITAARERQKYLAKVEVADLKPGDVIRFKSIIRPSYLAGLTGFVQQINQTTVTVRIQDAGARRYSGQQVRVPNTLIEKEA